MAGRKQAPIKDIFLAGEMHGLARRIDADALEKYLENAPSWFAFTDQCRAVIQFCRGLDNPKQRP
jgi:hypothetical protein